MALRTFHWNDANSITCKECVNNKNLMGSNIGVSSSIPNPVNFSPLNDSNSPSGNFTGEEVLKDTTAAIVNNDAQPQTLGNAAIGGSSEQYEVPERDLTFLFQKKLSETDCSLAAGRLLVPKRHAEKCFPILPGQPRMPLVINDVEGNAWNVNLRVTTYGNSTRYEIDGIRRCIQEMRWKAGNILTFYRQPDGEFFMELERREREPKKSTSRRW